MLSSRRDPGQIESLIGLYGVLVRKIAVRLVCLALAFIW
jgi:hypothetical protein